MKSAIDCRNRILEILYLKKFEMIENLANEFNVCRRTIERDIVVLSCLYPIFTSRGVHGGVFLGKHFKAEIRYMTSKQIALLEKLSLKLTGEELIIIKEIIRVYKRPVSV